MQHKFYANQHGHPNVCGHNCYVKRKTIYLREWRKRVPDLTQEKVADKLNTSAATVSRWETNFHDIPIHVLPIWAKMVGAEEVADLFRDPSHPETLGLRILRSMPLDKQQAAVRVLRAMAGEEQPA